MYVIRLEPIQEYAHLSCPDQAPNVTPNVKFIMTSSNTLTGHLAGPLCHPGLLALEISQVALVKSHTASRAAGADANANMAETPGGHTSNIGPDPHDAASPYDATSHDATGSPDADDAGSDTNSDAVSVSESEYVPSASPPLTAPSAAATPQVAWVDVEAVVAVHSEGQTEEANIEQAVAYTGYVLAARPDRVAVLGLYLGCNGFALVLAEPTGVYRTDCLPWRPPRGGPSGGRKRGQGGQRGQGGPLPSGKLPHTLLRRVLHYINNPPKAMIDTTIAREKGGTFEIRFQGEVFQGCIPKWCPSLGRWTVIFETSQGASIPILKEQYLRCEGASVDDTEGSILKMIHGPGVIPGVVRVGKFGPVTQEDGRAVECGLGKRRRHKVRLELKGQGDSFMAIKRPYDALVAIWDLLEGDTYTPHPRFATDMQN